MDATKLHAVCNDEYDDEFESEELDSAFWPKKDNLLFNAKKANNF